MLTQTDNRDVETIRASVDEVLGERRGEIEPAVRRCIADAFNVAIERVTPSATLTEELGGESLDFLDLAYRLETTFAVKIPRDGIRIAAQATLGPNFDNRGLLSEEALERLRTLLPEVDQSRLARGLTTTRINDLFTVETFVRLVAWQLAR
jgi:acyl carrier protein